MARVGPSNVASRGAYAYAATIPVTSTFIRALPAPFPRTLGDSSGTTPGGRRQSSSSELYARAGRRRYWRCPGPPPPQPRPSFQAALPTVVARVGAKRVSKCMFGSCGVMYPCFEVVRPGPRREARGNQGRL